jgi:hypothetical protein
MTATLLERPTLTAGCSKRWCLASCGCAQDDNHSDDLKLHKGRPSSIHAFGGATVDAEPTEFTEQDGTTTYSGPLVTVNVDDCDVDLSVAHALDFAATLATYAAGDVAVGSEITFYGTCTPGELSDAALTLRRLEDETLEYGDGAPRYMTFGVVELVATNPDGNPTKCSASTDAPSAAGFARYVAAVAVEVSP